MPIKKIALLILIFKFLVLENSYSAFEVAKSQKSTNKTNQEIDFVWSEIHKANNLKRIGNFSGAATHYKKAFYGLSNDMNIITPDRGTAGFYLIDAYEKLHQYDKALEILEILRTKFVNGDYGINKSEEIRLRLLSKKNQISNNVNRKADPFQSPKDKPDAVPQGSITELN